MKTINVWPLYHPIPEASGSRAINSWMSSLYRAPLFLARNQAQRICAAGWHFLSCYGRLALLTCSSGDPKFTLVPKIHLVWHLNYQMQAEAMQADYILNPMSEGCCVEEDVIGKFCCLTRHVSPRARVERSLQRYLTQVLLLWRR